MKRYVPIWTRRGSMARLAYLAIDRDLANKIDLEEAMDRLGSLIYATRRIRIKKIS